MVDFAGLPAGLSKLAGEIPVAPEGSGFVTSETAEITTPMPEAVGVVGLRNPNAANGLWPGMIPIELVWQVGGEGGLLPAGNADATMNFTTNGAVVGLFSEAGVHSEVIVILSIPVPQNYVEGENIVLTIYSDFDESGGAASVKTVAATAWAYHEDGTSDSVGSLVTTTVTGTRVGYPLTILGAEGVVPGELIILSVSLDITSNAAGDANIYWRGLHIS